MSKRYTMKDLLAEHPVFDHVVPAVAVVITLIVRGQVSPPNFELFLVGVATVSALVLSAATFVCALIYQSDASARVVGLRLRYAAELRRNWVSIFALTFVTSVAPLCAVLAVGTWVAPLVGVWAVAMLTVKASRTVYWLHYMLFTQHVDDARPQLVRSADRYSA